MLGHRMRVARLEDVLRGKAWAWSDATRRPSKRQKDLADILRILESHSHLESALPANVRDELPRRWIPPRSRVRIGRDRSRAHPKAAVAQGGDMRHARRPAIRPIALLATAALLTFLALPVLIGSAMASSRGVLGELSTRIGWAYCTAAVIRRHAESRVRLRQQRRGFPRTAMRSRAIISQLRPEGLMRLVRSQIQHAAALLAAARRFRFRSSVTGDLLGIRPGPRRNCDVGFYRHRSPVGT